MDFSKRVKIVREQLNISQEKLAAMLEVSFATVNRWEKGRGTPSYKAQEKFNLLCKSNGIKFDE